MAERPTAENDAAEIARLITASIAGRRWRDMTPLDVARYLVAHDVRVLSPDEGNPDSHEWLGMDR